MSEDLSDTTMPGADVSAPEPAEDAAPLATEELSVSEPENALPKVGLADLPEAMCAACARAGWQSLMPVQSLALPYLLEGRDIMVQSRTGSGKTGCYLLPMLPRLDPELKAPQALVLAPTRELAVQVEREAAVIFADTGIRTVAVYGGVGYKKQMDALREGAQVIVGTPGRVLDHLLRRTLDLKDLRVLVFDEADRMLSIGFYPDMKEVQRYLPKKRIHTCLFSATYPPHVLKLAAEFMSEPALLSLSQKEVHVAEVQHLFCEVKPMDKDRALVRLLETENPASAIIFCNTKANVHYVTGVLQGFGYSADELSADLSQNRREAVLDKIRKGRLQYLVATDVAARGIDIPALSHVFLYEPPEDHESYIHRARAHGARRGRGYGDFPGGRDAAHGAGAHRQALQDRAHGTAPAHGRRRGQGGGHAPDRHSGGALPHAHRPGTRARGPLRGPGARTRPTERGRGRCPVAGHAAGRLPSAEPARKPLSRQRARARQAKE